MKLLFADDNPLFLKHCLYRHIEDQDLTIDVAKTPTDYLSRIEQTDYNIVLLDVSFTPGGSEGVELVKKLKAIKPQSMITMLSGNNDQETILVALNNGASD